MTESNFLNRIFLKSCESMSEIPEGTVDLTVTSPPYWNAIDYDIHSTHGKSEDYRPRQTMDYEEYFAFLMTCFEEMLRVTREGGIAAVIVGTVLMKGKHIPLPFHLVGRMQRIGWDFHQDIIWSKCTGGIKRASSTIKNPSPGYYYPNIMTEYILLFRKPGERKIFAGRSPEEKERDRVEIDSVFKNEVANNIWHIAPVPPKQFDHPCPFPEEIPYRLVRWFTYQGDTVLDPFCGIGTTLKVANQTGRKWIGYEIQESYVERSHGRVNEELVLRKQLITDYKKIEYGEQLPPKSGSTHRFRQTVEP